MSKKVFIVKDWMYVTTDAYPSNIYPIVVGIYSSLSLAKEQILKRAARYHSILVNPDMPQTKFSVIEEHHLNRSGFKTENSYQSAPFQTWTFLADGRLYIQSQRIDELYIPQELLFSIGDWVEIVDVTKNLLLAGIVNGIPATAEYLANLRQNEQELLEGNSDRYWNTDSNMSLGIGGFDIYHILTSEGRVNNLSGYVFPLSKPVSEDDRKTVENMISAMLKLRAIYG